MKNRIIRTNVISIESVGFTHCLFNAKLSVSVNRRYATVHAIRIWDILVVANGGGHACCRCGREPDSAYNSYAQKVRQTQKN